MLATDFFDIVQHVPLTCLKSSNVLFIFGYPKSHKSSIRTPSARTSSGVKFRYHKWQHSGVLPPRTISFGDDCQNLAVKLFEDLEKIVVRNAMIFESWFKTSFVAFVLDKRPKCFNSDRSVTLGLVPVFKKSEIVIIEKR